ncbi:MAG: hypothetical protein OEZ23_05845 [Gammaproteobacteria bacterium]|nr:hypothetical protein [Gammaproteobacteria bacterium]
MQARLPEHYPVLPVPLITGLLPIITVHLTYLVSAWEGYVPWCFVYIDSCASISATGRHGTAFYLFKGLMIPAAFCLMLYWRLTHRWLLGLGEQSQGVRRAIICIGIIGAVALILYTLALGAGTEYLRIQRRIGVIIYFTFTFLAQLLLSWRLGLLLKNDSTRRWQLTLCYGVLGIGISTLFLDILLPNYEDYEDAFEWIMALGIHCYFLVTWRTGRGRSKVPE